MRRQLTRTAILSDTCETHTHPTASRLPFPSTFVQVLITLRAYRFLFFVFQDEAARVAAKKFALETRSKLLQRGCAKSPIEVYVNYAHGDEGPVAWYSERKP